MATTHTVEQGECLSSLAAQYKLASWEVIYNDPNNADLKASRPNPNVLLPGDQVFIPDPKQREDDAATDLRHIFVMSFPPTYINICVQDLAAQPIANAKYELALEAVTLSGSTDNDGWIRGQIPASAELGTLQVWPDPDDPDTVVQWSVNLGYLDPSGTTSGAKGRLNNLSYACGDVDDTADDLYQQMLSQFQQDTAADPDGASPNLENTHLV